MISVILSIILTTQSTARPSAVTTPSEATTVRCWKKQKKVLNQQILDSKFPKKMKSTLKEKPEPVPHRCVQKKLPPLSHRTKTPGMDCIWILTIAHIIEENQYHVTFPTFLCITFASFNVKTQQHDDHDQSKLMMMSDDHCHDMTNNGSPCQS